jgi:hypothetical protein
VAVRDRFATPAPPPARAAAIRDALRDALIRQPMRLLLVDTQGAETLCPAARTDAVAALAAQGVTLEIATRLPSDGDAAGLVVRLLRAHDGAAWIGTLRAAGFAGPVVGWLIEDDRDPAANQDIARGLDVVVPARAARRSALLQEAALVLPALTPPCGLVAGSDTAAPMHAGAGTPADLAVQALLAGQAPADPAGLDVPADADARRALGRSLLLAPRMQALVAALRSAVDRP